MKSVKSIWNLKIHKKEKVSIREKAVKGLAAFLAVMFLFTVLSRAANAMTIARVTTESPEKKTIEHTVKVDGTVEAGGEIPVSTIAGLKIKSIKVQAGTRVEKGDLLAEIDLDDLNEKIKEQEKELAKFDLSIADAQYNQNQAENEKATSRKRAQEDYSSTASAEEQKVDRAYKQMMDAYNEWEDFKKNPPQADEEGAEGVVDERSLKAAYEEKKGLYEDTVTARNQALKEANRAIEDANKGTAKESTAQSAGIDRKAVEEKLEKYNKLRKNKGVIKAKSKGIITSLDASATAGGITPETSLMLISKMDSGLKVTAQLDEEQQKQLSIGDEITLLDKNYQEITGLKIDSMAPNAEDPTMKDIVINLGKDETLQVYDSVTVKATSSSKAYSSCISKKALHKGENGAPDYVLLLVEKESVLGVQYVLEKHEVILEDDNETYAALQDGTLTADQSIVVEADKEVVAGDRVRLAESNE